MKCFVWMTTIIISGICLTTVSESRETTSQIVDQNDDAQIVAQVANAFVKIVHGAVVVQNSAGHKDNHSQQDFESAAHEIAAGIAIIQSIAGGRSIHTPTLEQTLLAVLKKIDKATLDHILRIELADLSLKPVDAQ